MMLAIWCSAGLFIPTYFSHKVFLCLLKVGILTKDINHLVSYFWNPKSKWPCPRIFRNKMLELDETPPEDKTNLIKNIDWVGKKPAS